MDFAPSPTLITEALLEAPGWARVGITVPDERMRHRAATELANTILDRLANPPADIDANQLPLAL